MKERLPALSFGTLANGEEEEEEEEDEEEEEEAAALDVFLFMR
jgi:hypothetical protein